jgi:hypothetical protein
MMPNKIGETTWVYVVVQNPGDNEQILGQQDAEKDASYIPTFLDKTSAQECFLNLVREKGQRYEIQAIIFGDLIRYASEGDFYLLMLDGSGEVLETYLPSKE